MSNSEPAVVVKDLYKSFRLPHEQSSGLKHSIVNFIRQKKGYEIQKVLNDVSFEINKGEFFGIVGRNGSGKSTLLKLLAGIYTPDSGLVHINGSLTPFIELGVGFNPELTGRENVYLNGALLGFSRSEMEAMYDDIVAFAELGRFMDQRLKNYSSGMQVRLAFSIAIRAKTDVLVLDEVLAVGDEAFQRKCFEYFGSLKANKKTVILVTHDMASVERFCDRALLLEKGSIKFIGDKTEAAYLYNEQFLQEESARKSRENKKKFDTNAEKRDGRQRLESVSITQGADKDTTALKAGVDFTINFDVSSLEDVKDAVFGFHAYTSQGVLAFSVNTEERKVSVTLKKNKTVRLSFHIENIYTDDTYAISAAMVRKGKDGYLLHLMKFFEFSIGGTKYLRTSLTHPRTSIKIEELS